MAVMAKLHVNSARTDGVAPDPWAQAVELAADWAGEHHIALRDAVFLVPFAQHLPLARQAWAARGGWMPQVDTTQTLTRRVAPAPPPHADDIRFDAGLDTLTARRLLRGQTVFARWLRDDPRSFAQAAGALVDTAQALARAMACEPPAQRDAQAAAGRAALGASAGVGGAERHLARMAFEWAMACTAPATDVLFALRPSAWIVLQAGGVDALVHRLVHHLVPCAANRADATDQTPVLWIDSDPPGDDVIATMAMHAEVQVCAAASFEDEAQRAAAQVLFDLASRGAPVALIAQDRLLTRRISALLRRAAVPLRDETGWTLSTTRAAASLALLLRAASPQATCDNVLDAIKCWPAGHDDAAVAALEAALHRHHWARPAAVNPQRLAAHAAALWAHAAGALEPLRSAGAQPWSAWRLRLSAALHASGLAATLAADEAGQQVLAALHLHDASAAIDSAESWTLADASRWVDTTLEQATFIPHAPDAPAVIVMPAARALLRPFAAVVWPGADDRHLGAPAPPHPLLKDAELAALGLPTMATRSQRETVAFAHLLQAAPVTLLWRTDDDGEPLSVSPLIERWMSARRHSGLTAAAPAAEQRVTVVVLPQPVARPLPSAPDLLPARMSASACESLRECPYRFFALRMLRLQAADELDGEIEKRDYGTWLHAVLHRFHACRAPFADAPLADTLAAARGDAHALVAAAAQVQIELAFDAADFLPFAASFERFAPRYLAWLHQRDRSGALWLDGERDWTAHPEAWAGTAMQGVIDRIDSLPGDRAAGPVTQLIDYKTGSTAGLRDKVNQPLEDTQLPFYAALAAEQGRSVGDIGPLDALYLSLDDPKQIVEVRHPDVQRSAQMLVAGIGRDLARLRGGAALPALGEGSACEHCDARGLCRRDQWAAASADAVSTAPVSTLVSAPESAAVPAPEVE